MPAKAAPAKTQLSSVYDQLESLLKKYSPPFTTCPTGKVGNKRTYGLWSKKEVEIAGRKMPAMYFASFIEQKAYVAFHFVPIYITPSMKNDLSPRLAKLLKGKGCFQIKSLEDGLLSDVKAALDLALKAYRKNGWV